MRLWQKIFLTTLALMVFSTTLASTLLLKASRDALWQREGQRAVTQQQYLAGMLRAGVISHRLQLGVVQLDEEETRRTAIQVLSQQATDDYLSGIVFQDGDGQTLYAVGPVVKNDGGDLAFAMTDLPPAPEEDPDAAVYELRRGVSEGEWFLVCAMPLTLESLHCRFGGAYAVGDLQAQLTRQAIGTVALCLGLSLAGAGILLALVWVLLRPLGALSRSTRLIAEGNYDKRLTVRGKDELADLALDMNAMAQAVQERVEQLEQVAEDRKVFIGNLAHEMKTPLTSILGFADLLYLPKEVPDSKRVEYAKVISEEAKRLKSLSGKLLELITLGSTNLTLEPVSLREVAGEVAVSLKPVMAQSELTLRVLCPDVTIDMDRELFKSLLYNLLDNGRKASERGGRLELAAQADGGQVSIVVRDYGRGIPREELDKVVQPFYMVDKSRARKAGGAGLGLALCQEIVSVHGGTMEIHSVVGVGTGVRMTFPVSGGSAREKGGAESAQ